MTENAAGEYADDDPEYDADAAADVDAETPEFEPADPAALPADEGDVGSLIVPEGTT